MMLRLEGWTVTNVAPAPSLLHYDEPILIGRLNTCEIKSELVKHVSSSSSSFHK